METLPGRIQTPQDRIDQKVESFLQVARAYMDAPSTVEPTLDEDRHAARTAVLQQHGQAALEEYGNNQLRNNRVWMVKGKLDLIILALDKAEVTTPQAQALREAAMQFPKEEEFRTRDPEERQRLARKIREVCTQCFAILSDTDSNKS